MSCCPEGKNTTAGKTAWDLPRWIENWKDLDYESLSSIYGGALQNALHTQFTLQTPPAPFGHQCKISSEEEFQAIVNMWSNVIVSQALDRVQKQPNSPFPHAEVCIGSGKSAQLPSQLPPSVKGKRRTPDWAGKIPSTVNPNDKKAKPKNILPGDTKVSPKWKSGRIQPGKVGKNKYKEDWIQPIGQIYTYCVRVNARYGYIITDMELIVFRIRPAATTDDAVTQEEEEQAYKALDPAIDLGSSREKEPLNSVEGAPEATRALAEGIMEYKAIPWSNHVGSPETSKVLTVNLVLWCLHLMAADCSGIKSEYTPLRDASWNVQTRGETPVFPPAPEVPSQESGPLTETSFNSQLSAMSSPLSKTGHRKRGRDDDEGDHETVIQASPPKRQPPRKR